MSANFILTFLWSGIKIPISNKDILIELNENEFEKKE